MLFGIGLGLTIDEYALALHLDDVYASREGRSSIDATLIALGLFGLVLLAFVPTRIDTDSPAVLATTVGAATLHFGWVLIAAAFGGVTEQEYQAQLATAGAPPERSPSPR